MSQILQQLIDGNKQFREKFFSEQSTVFEALVAQGQRPKVMVVACSDSRVDPAMIFNSQPGDLFVIRNVANLVPPCESSDTYHGTSAALEFGTCFLDVEHIIILGHTHCGGIRALLEIVGKGPTHPAPHSFIAKWIELARPAYDKVMMMHPESSFEQKASLCEQYALANSLQHLSTFAWIRDRVERGTLMVHAWYFDLATGTVRTLGN